MLSCVLLSAFLIHVIYEQRLLVNLQLLTLLNPSESTSIPKNPRTERPVGYAFVDLSTPSEAERAIAELSGKEILERKVSVQLARKPEQNAEKTEGATASGAEAQNGEERRASGRGRGRGRGRGGRDRRTGRGVSSESSKCSSAHMLTSFQGKEEGAEGATGEVLPLTDTTNLPASTEAKDGKGLAREARRERGPPADGIPSKTKVMVANLPYDLSEEKVRIIPFPCLPSQLIICIIAQGALCRLRAILCQDRPSPHPPLHGQEAPGPQRASQGPWLRLCHPCLRGAAAEGRQRDEREGDRRS